MTTTSFTYRLDITERPGWTARGVKGDPSESTPPSYEVVIRASFTVDQPTFERLLAEGSIEDDWSEWADGILVTSEGIGSGDSPPAATRSALDLLRSYGPVQSEVADAIHVQEVAI